MSDAQKILGERLSRSDIMIEEYKGLSAILQSEGIASTKATSIPSPPLTVTSQQMESVIPEGKSGWSETLTGLAKLAFYLIAIWSVIGLFRENPSAGSFEQHIDQELSRLAASGAAGGQPKDGFDVLVNVFCTAAPKECGQLIKTQFKLEVSNFLLFSTGEVIERNAPYRTVVSCSGFAGKWHC